MARTEKEKKEYFKKWYVLNKEKCLEKSRLQSKATKPRATKPRVLKKGNCSECNKEGIYVKGLCQACYCKKQRQTPEGKARTKTYNDTKGVESRAKFLAKKGKTPKNKEEKQLCKCGNKSIAKGMCRNCYQNERYIPKNECGKPGRKGLSDSEKKELYDRVFNLVSKKRITISNACVIENINRNVFYKIISPYQKQSLKGYKIPNKVLNNDDYIINDLF